jgi:hypothetical protein
MLGLYSGSFIQAMGGQLQIRTVFPEGKVQIEQFEGVVAPTADSRQEDAASHKPRATESGGAMIPGGRMEIDAIPPLQRWSKGGISGG